MNDKTIAEPDGYKKCTCNYAYIIMVIYRPTMQGIGQTQSSLITQIIQVGTPGLRSTCRRDVSL